MAENENIQENIRSIEDFEKIVITIINNANDLKKYDYFGSLTILNVIQLMLSKSEEYVKKVQQGVPFRLEDLTRGHGISNMEDIKVPEEVMSEVDEVISIVKEKLENEKD